MPKKRVMNQGKIQKFYIEDDHKAIIEPWLWECVQLEIERRKRYQEELELREDLLVVYRAKDFMELMKLETVDMDINSV